jgi:hypothetical protein
MAYLSPPLTIIDNQSNSQPSIVSVPPAATWFDEDRQHFVALKGVPKGLLTVIDISLVVKN